MNREAASDRRPGPPRGRAGGSWRAVALLLSLSVGPWGCAAVAPQQRAILADPSMQFDAEAKHEGALRHALENREGSMGGTGVSGGGCGCN